MRVAVCGGSGDIGRAVIKALVERGHSAINLDRRQSPDRVARFCMVDLAHREQVQPILENVDAVVQLAEITNSNMPYAPDHIFSHNCRVTSGILQTAADLQLKRVIYTSSCQVYGCWDHVTVPPLRLPMDETHPVQPQNVYALSKVANESYAQHLARHEKLSVAVCRLPWVIREMREWVFHWLEHDHGQLEGMGTYVHASDVAQAYVLALENPRPGCEIYNFSAPDVVSSVPIRQRLIRDHPEHPKLPEDWPAFRSPLITAKLKEHFGFEAKFSIHEAYRQRFGKAPGA